MRRCVNIRVKDVLRSLLPALDLSDMNAGCFDGNSWKASGEVVNVVSPIDGNPTGVKVQLGNLDDFERCVENSYNAKKNWMAIPAPIRGDVVRQIGNELRDIREPLGKLLSIEVGKIIAEGIGEVQEYIDICDLACGYSRQIPGHVFPSERPQHFMMEQWHPLGVLGIIAAFNFPIAVAGWNSAVSLVCGNTQIWKNSPTTNLCSIATQKVVARVLKRSNIDPSVATLICGGRDIGAAMANDDRIPIVSFTGSTEVGREVGRTVAGRFGKSILELGGNNAIVVLPDADKKLAIRSVLFGAVGTCGQRCTTCRRLYLHKSFHDEFLNELKVAYSQVKIGNPLNAGVLCGPLHSLLAVDNFMNAVSLAKSQGGEIICGGKKCEKDVPGPNYVLPTIISIANDAPIVNTETFAPILYVMKYETIEEAIALNNSVSQGLSSSIFTKDIQNIMKWTGASGSDCGIVNVNIPTNGAEIGGAFGGEKATGGGRESGSDAWKQYCRRATTTINYGTSLPLAQGINFS